MGKDLTTFTFSRKIRFLVYTLMPRMMKALRVKLFPQRPTDFFKDLVTDSIKIREAQGIGRADMIHLLLEARKGRNQIEGPPNVDTGFASVEETMKAEQKKLKSPTLISQPKRRFSFLLVLKQCQPPCASWHTNFQQIPTFRRGFNKRLMKP